ncbi:MAG TPA: FkbM family methyltransferase [Cyclobacteriaceae bacterium]|nr:FkbM family methyltransferase [Cyclobacteriaceae bacterium]
MNFIYQIWNLFFEKLYSFSLRQMNFGRASNYRSNGELYSLKQLARRWADRNVTLFDVGANVGEFTLEILEAFRNKPIQLYAFEPSSRAGEQLRKRIPQLPNVHVVAKAMSDHEGTAELFFPDEGSALASLYQRDLAHMNQEFGKKEQVVTSTIDRFCEENKIDYIHLLKIDVEGHEIEVLKGARKMMTGNAIEVIQFEFGGTNLDSRSFFKDFFQLLSPKYKLYRILPKGLRELPKYSERLEIYYSANYLAIRR